MVRRWQALTMKPEQADGRQKEIIFRVVVKWQDDGENEQIPDSTRVGFARERTKGRNHQSENLIVVP